MKDKEWKEKFQKLGLSKQNILFKEANKKYFYQKSIISRLIKDAKRRVKRRKLPFSLTEKDILLPKHCPALGIPLFKGVGRKVDNSPTLDRIDNNKGYVPSNIQILSSKANIMKSDCSVKEIKQIYNNFLLLQQRKFAIVGNKNKQDKNEY